MGYCLKVEDPYLQGFCQSQSFKVMLFFNEDEIWISFRSLYLEMVRIMYLFYIGLCTYIPKTWDAF